MKCLLFAFSCFVVLATSAHADPKASLFRNYLKKQRAGLFLESSIPDPKIGFFDQRVDHFAKEGSRRSVQRFKQRYFIDSSLAEGEHSPVLFYICGESTCEGPSDSLPLNRIARRYRAHRVALEHRFYGESQPFQTLTPENLRFLSMDQALQDLASFQSYAEAVLGLKGKWVSVGGSYPGELSAFYRMRHPEKVVGALASSAPVFAKADFFEYDRHVARIADPECLRVIQKVVSDVESRLKEDRTRFEVKRLFQVERVENDGDVLYVLADMAAIAIQYGFQKRFCGGLIDGERKGDPVQAYANEGIALMSMLGTTPFQTSFQGAMSLDPADHREYSARQWMYQSCTEFGFFQGAHADPKETARSKKIDLKYHHDACERLFGLKQPVEWEKTNERFYSRLFRPEVNRIYFTNGSNDPWSNLSLIDGVEVGRLNPGLELLLIEGAAHCDDLGTRILSGLTTARQRFDDLFGKWISE